MRRAPATMALLTSAFACACGASAAAERVERLPDYDRDLRACARTAQAADAGFSVYAACADDVDRRYGVRRGDGGSP